MAALLVMDPDQVAADRAGWLARKRQDDDGHWCVSASEIASVCGIAPRRWGGPYALYHKKLAGEEIADADEMRRGRAVEPIVLEEFADEHPGLAMLPGGLYCRKEAPWQLATFDAQAVEFDTYMAQHRELRRIPDAEHFPVEAKTSIPTDEFGDEEDSSELPVHIRAQALWQAHVRGASVVFVVVKFMVPWVTRTYVLHINGRERDEIAWMEEQAGLFTARLERRDPPPVDWYPATTETLRRQYPGSGIEPDAEVRVPWRLALRYRAGVRAEAALEERRGLVKNLLLARAQDAGRIVARDPVTRRMIKIASRTSGPMPERKLKAIERVDRLNPSGWARSKRERDDG